MSITDRFVAVDLETTGLSHGEDKITEVALVRFENGIETACFQTLINPAVKIPERAVEITGISNEMVADAPYIDEVVRAIAEFAGEDVLVGHSIMFDYGFLKKAMANAVIPFEKKGIDTLKIARKVLPELEHKKLDYLCEYFGIEEDHHHRALNDARVTGRLLLKLWEMFGEKNEEVFNPYELNYRARKEGPITPAQIKKLNHLIELYGISKDFEVEKLTKNEASRKIDKIMSIYGII